MTDVPGRSTNEIKGTFEKYPDPADERGSGAGHSGNIAMQNTFKNTRIINTDIFNILVLTYLLSQHSLVNRIIVNTYSHAITDFLHAVILENNHMFT